LSTTPALDLPPGCTVTGDMRPEYAEILTDGALRFVSDLARRFGPRVSELLARRVTRQAEIDGGQLPDFLHETQAVRDSDWRVTVTPADLADRRVEITGPTDRKMIINALNSGARVFMADCEDSLTPTWDNVVGGQINLRDAVTRRIEFQSPDGRAYRLNSSVATLIVRPRGWHLPEKHLQVDGQPVPGAFVDFGLYLFHNHAGLKQRGSGPYFYLPKTESHLEARLWADVFRHAEQVLGLTPQSIKATVLIETILAAFEMDEILWELKDYIVGLNCGRWDYIFSFIKKFSRYPEFVLPDRQQVTMTTHFLRSYSRLLIKTCHRRGAYAMGGMAAQIPIKNDPAANDAAFAKVRADKEREVRDGYDGTWVAHPDLVPVAREVFDRMMPEKNQITRVRQHVRVLREDLLQIHTGTKTEEGFRLNIRVGVQYIEAWLRGRGAVPIYNLMEDAATAEISRAQIWQWIRYEAELDDGIVVTPKYFERALTEEMERVKDEVGADTYAKGRFPEAIALFRDISLSDAFVDFLTIPAYRLIV